MKLKKGDTVIVTVGKDRGRRGKVERVFPKEGRVLVGGVNVFKRHMKKRDEKRPSSIIDITKPIDVSKLAIMCPKCNQPTRIGYIVTKGLPASRQGEKVRICRKCEQKL